MVGSLIYFVCFASQNTIPTALRAEPLSKGALWVLPYGLRHHCHPSHTSGQNPTVACRPLRTMGVRRREGSSKSFSSLA